MNYYPPQPIPQPLPGERKQTQETLELEAEKKSAIEHWLELPMTSFTDLTLNCLVWVYCAGITHQVLKLSILFIGVWGLVTALTPIALIAGGLTWWLLTTKPHLSKILGFRVGLIGLGFLVSAL